MPAKNKKIAFFPGSFKPPHDGHFDIVKKLLKTQDKIYIIISSKTRYYPNNSINNHINNKNRISVNKNQSKECWEKWIKKLPKTQQDKIVLSISNLPSPIMSATGMAERICAIGDKCSFVKSAKNASNKRFEGSQELLKSKGIPTNILTIGYKQTVNGRPLSATNIRRKMFEQRVKKKN